MLTDQQWTQFTTQLHKLADEAIKVLTPEATTTGFCYKFTDTGTYTGYYDSEDGSWGCLRKFDRELTEEELDWLVKEYE